MYSEVTMVKAAKDPQYLAKLQDYYARWRSLPSYNRLCDLLGLASRSAVSKVLVRLKAEGYLSRTPDGVWIPAALFFERPLATTNVPAGPPLAASDLTSDTLAVDEYLVKNPSSTTLVTVSGDSMVGVGIFSGDVAVVERDKEAKAGDLVIAVVDGELTLKTLVSEGGNYLLQPANPDYETIRPLGSLEIFGVVVGLIRKYRK